MAWRTLETATQLNSITTEQFFSVGGSQHIPLEPGEHAALEVAVDFPASPGEHALVAIYPSTDGGTTYANSAFPEYTVESSLDPHRFSIIVQGVPGFRVGIRRSGASMTITNANLKVRRSGVAL